MNHGYPDRPVVGLAERKCLDSSMFRHPVQERRYPRRAAIRGSVQHHCGFRRDTRTPSADDPGVPILRAICGMPCTPVGSESSRSKSRCVRADSSDASARLSQTSGVRTASAGQCAHAALPAGGLRQHRSSGRCRSLGGHIPHPLLTIAPRIPHPLATVAAWCVILEHFRTKQVDEKFDL
jgi:hypothetical protein